MIIEWNAHMFSRDLERFPFHPQAYYIPDEANLLDDPLASYVQHMDEEGIDRAVIVQPGPYIDDHTLVLDCLAREPDRLKGAILFHPYDPEAARKLEKLLKQEPRIVATRFHGGESHVKSFADAEVRSLWRTAGELGLIIELHIGPKYAAQAAEVAAMYPEFTVLIDHVAEPKTGDAVEFADVLEMARLDNVYMKLSGLNHFSTAVPLHLDAKPLTRLIVDAFGPDRMVWGSGTPGIVDAHLEGFSEEDRAKVKGGNLAALLGFAETG